MLLREACVLALFALVLLAGWVYAKERSESVRFRYDPVKGGTPGAKQVFLAGSFNAWSTSACPLKRGAEGCFSARLTLKEGVHSYKFVVDGKWVADPENPLRDSSGHGNSLKLVGQAKLPPLKARPPRLTQGRAGAFKVVPASRLPAPPRGLRARPLYVYLPPSYGRDPQRRFPVLYLHDGQNVWSDPQCCFGHGGWFLDATCEALWRAGKLEEFILVGVPNSPARMREYGTPDLYRARQDAYARYLVETVKPYVDRTYRTLKGPRHSALMGSSLGGLVSFTLGLSYPEVFGQVACLSSSFWFKDAQGRSSFDLLQKRGKQPLRIYLDSGTGGRAQDGAPATRRMAKALAKAGWKAPAELEHHEATGALHNERAWRARAARPLRFLFGKTPPKR